MNGWAWLTIWAVGVFVAVLLVRGSRVADDAFEADLQRDIDGRRLALIIEQWPHIVGAEVAEASRPVAIAAGGVALVIETDNPNWSHQLSFLEREIVRGVNDLNAGPIERLRFRLPRKAA